jgi:G3E family GTPase
MKLPVSIITGFLGSGKTTLLNRLLQHPGLKNSLVIINEFGEVGIDHLLVSTPTENTRLLNNGCLCCAVRGELVETLAEAARQRRDGLIPRFDRVLIETTGLADPVPIVQTLVNDDELTEVYRLDSVIGVIDAVHALSQLDAQREAVKQIAVSDLLLVSKVDLADERTVRDVEARAREINAGAELMRAVHGEVDPQRLFGRSPGVARSEEEIARWLGQQPVEATYTPHTQAVTTFTLFRDEPATRSGLATWLSMLAGFKGPQLLRIKGLVNVGGDPIVIHAVQTVIHEPVQLPAWPGEDRRSRIVFIVRGLSRESLERTLSAFSMPELGSAPRIDPAAYARFVEAAKRFM